MTKMVKLKDIAELTVGYVGNMSKEYVNSGVKFLRSLNIESFSINEKDLLYISSEFNEKIKKSKLHTGDIVIVRTGKPGTCCVIKKEYDGCNCSDLVILHPDENRVNSYYLEAYINFMAKKQINNNQVGAVQKHFNIGSAKEMMINLPDKEVQNKIGTFVEVINSKIENNNAINLELEAMARTIYDYWFLQFDFPDENGKPYKSFGGKMIWNEELKREIPEDWKAIRLGEIFDFIKGKLPTQLYEEQNNGLVGYLTIEAVNEGAFQYCKSDFMILTNGEVLMVMDGAASSEVYVGNKGAIGSTFCKLQIKDNFISDNLLYLIMKKYESVFKKVNTGSTVPHANKNYINDFCICIPKELEERQKLQKVFDEIIAKIIHIKKENQEIASLRDFLLPLLMNGQVRFKEC